MKARYHFSTHIELSTPPEEVWETLAASEGWGNWWRWLREVEVLDEGREDGVGRRVRHVVSSPLRYRLSYVGLVTRTVEPVMSRFEAEGDLEGRGQFWLETTESGTTVLTLQWLVQTPKTWMNLLAPVGRPIFAWSHHRLMEDFGEDLARVTSGELYRVENRSLDPDDESFFEMPSL